MGSGRKSKSELIIFFIHYYYGFCSRHCVPAHRESAGLVDGQNWIWWRRWGSVLRCWLGDCMLDIFIASIQHQRKVIIFRQRCLFEMEKWSRSFPTHNDIILMKMQFNTSFSCRKFLVYTLHKTLPSQNNIKVWMNEN